MILTFFMAVIGWIIFRAESIGMAWEYMKGMMQFGTLRASYRFFSEYYVIDKSIYVIFMLLVEWLNRTHNYEFEGIKVAPKWMRLLAYCIIAMLIFMNIPLNGSMNFVYFQF